MEMPLDVKGCLVSGPRFGDQQNNSPPAEPRRGGKTEHKENEAKRLLKNDPELQCFVRPIANRLL